MKIDLGGAVLSRHGAHPDVFHGTPRPGGRIAAILNAGRMFVLAAADGLEECGEPHSFQGTGCLGLELHFIALLPFDGIQERAKFLVAFVDRQRRAEIDEVAVEVDIVFIDAAMPCKATGIDRMHHHSMAVRPVDRDHIVCKKAALDFRPEIPLDTVRSRGYHQQVGALGVSARCNIREEIDFAGALQRVGDAVDLPLRQTCI